MHDTDPTWTLTRRLLHAAQAPGAHDLSMLARATGCDLPVPAGLTSPLAAWVDYLVLAGGLRRDGDRVLAASGPRTLNLDLHLLRHVRERIAQAVPTPGQARRGWQIHPRLDPEEAVRAVPTLRLRPDHRLTAYLYRDGAFGRAQVWATPGADPAPPPAGLPQIDIGDLAVPKPPGALTDPLDAIETDGTPLAAAHLWLLGCAFSDLGARGAGIGWSSHELLDGPPWLLPGDGFQQASPAPSWRWSTQPPTSWAPALQVTTTGSMTLTVHTWTALHTERVERHTVKISPDGHPRRQEVSVLGTGPGGMSL